MEKDEAKALELFAIGAERKDPDALGEEHAQGWLDDHGESGA